jgi:pimeloyl-ACP methyl ester carboxylesterase
MPRKPNVLEQRAFPRAPTYTQIKAHLRHRQQHLSAELGNISVGGMLVWVDHPWAPGTILDFEFCLLDEVRPYIGRAEVMRVQKSARRLKDSYGLGLKFLSVNPKPIGLAEMARWATHMSEVALGEAVEAMRYAWGELHGNRPDERELGRPTAGFREPVLMLHGWLGTRGVLRFVEQRLKQAGFPVFSIDLGLLNVHDIPRSAQLVSDKVQRLSERFGLGRISAVGHSMGGLIALWGLKKLQLADHVRRLIAVGSPFKGTPWAWVGLGPFALFYRSLLEMTPNSSFLHDLNQGPLPANVEVHCIAARNDLLVTPASATLDGACNFLIDGGHASLITSRYATNKIVAILEGKDPFVPS